MSIQGVFVKVDGAYELVGSGTPVFIKTAGSYSPWTGPTAVIKANGVYVRGTGELPVNITPPVIAGVAEVGETLTCTPGTWGGSPAPALTRRWFADSLPLIGQTDLTHVVTETDAGHTLTCVEIASNIVGSAAESSNGIAIPVYGFSSGFSNGFK